MCVDLIKLNLEASSKKRHDRLHTRRKLKERRQKDFARSHLLVSKGIYL